MQALREDDWRIIVSPRLSFTLLSIPMLDALIDFDRDEIRRLTALDFQMPWTEEIDFLKLRKGNLLADPDYAPWAPRAIARRDDHVVIGHIGFHTRPDADYLRDRVPGGVELGYTIFEPYRGRGYAREACRAMMHWAHGFAGVEKFVLSIGPDNAASLAIAGKLGF